jgi:thioredoxin 2
MGRPPIFQALALDEAIAVARRTGRVLLVDVTAPKCGPCQVMDHSTWSDRALIEALRDRALAIQVDAGEHSAVAERLAVRTMPTVLVFKDGAEIDRVTGLQNTAQILTWLDGLERGETALTRMRAELDERDVSGRLQLARVLVEQGRCDEALREYLWLWQNMVEIDPEMSGVRHSFMLGDIEELVEMHPAARAAFARVRDASAPSREGTPNVERFADWLSLTKVVGDGTPSPLNWFDAWWPTASERIDGASEEGRQLLWCLEQEIVPLLVEQGRWADAGSLYRAPVQALQHSIDIYEETKRFEPDNQELLRFMQQMLRNSAARLVRCLRCAGRVDEATQVDAAAKRADPSESMAIALRRAHDDSLPQ